MRDKNEQNLTSFSNEKPQILEIAGAYLLEWADHILCYLKKIF
jgi:hypothetical protein